MKRHTIILFSLFAVMCLMAGCIKRTTFHTPHPEKGALVVRAYYAHRSQESVSADTLYAIVDADTLKSDTSVICVPRLLEPGTHSVLVYNVPEGFADEDTAFAVVFAEDGGIVPDAGYFYMGHEDVAISADDTLKFDFPLVQHTKRLDFEFTVTGGSLDMVESVNGTLTGVARSVRKDEGTLCGDPVSSHRMFEVARDTVRAGYHLPGFCEDVPKTLKLNVIFVDGHEQEFEIVLDAYLKEFNMDVDRKVLKGRFDVRTGVAFGFVIDGWKQTDDYETGMENLN